MTSRHKRPVLPPLTAAAAGAFIALVSLFAQAQPSEAPTAEQIIEALKARGKLRSGPVEQSRAQQEQTLLESLKLKAPRGLSPQERADLASLAKERPSVDLVIYFDFNSAEISQKAMATLTSLGKALSTQDLKGQTFLVAGHTDAIGTDEFNQTLSERRARAVKQFLAEKFGLPDPQLLAVGYGKEQLKNTANPAAEENRRVQVVNLGK